MPINRFDDEPYPAPRVVQPPAPRFGSGKQPIDPKVGIRRGGVMPATSPTAMVRTDFRRYNEQRYNPEYLGRTQLSQQITPADLGITQPFTRPSVSGGRGFYVPYTYQGVPGSYDTLTGDFIVNGIQVGNLANSGGGGGSRSSGGGGGRSYSSPFSMGLVNWRI